LKDKRLWFFLLILPKILVLRRKNVDITATYILQEDVMNNQLSFIKGISIICLPIFLSFFNCSSEVDVQTVEMEPQLTDVLALGNVIEDPLTLTFKFGEENLPDEYLLAHPERVIASDISGNIYLFDEYRVKVYDQDGKPKAIFGDWGEGPGYFLNFGSEEFMFVSEKGFLIIGDYQTANVFYPDHTFLKRYRFQANMDPWQSFFSENGYKSETEHYVYVIDENRRIFRLIAIKNDDEFRENPKDLIIYQDGDKNTLIAEYDYVAGSGMDEFGQLFFSVLPGERLIYTHGRFDTRVEDDKGIYTLHIVDLNTGDKSEISLPFTPRMFNDSLFRIFESRTADPRLREDARYRSSLKALNEKQLRQAKEFKYYPPLIFLMNDGDYVFLWHYPTGEPRFTVDVINTKEKQHTGTMILTEETIDSMNPKAWVFVNGKAYFLIVPMDEFAYVQVCSIDPAVYGK